MFKRNRDPYYNGDQYIGTESKKRKILKIMLLIFLFPFSWIYWGIKLFTNWRDTHMIAKKYIILSIFSVLFMFAALSPSDKSDDNSDKVLKNEISTSSEIITSADNETNTTTETQSNSDEQTTTQVESTTEITTQIETTPQIMTQLQTEPQTVIQQATELITEPLTEVQAQPQTRAQTQPQTEIQIDGSVSVTQSDTQEQMVWVTKTGKKYHSIPDCGNTKSAYQEPLSEALSRGLEACQNCH